MTNKDDKKERQERHDRNLDAAVEELSQHETLTTCLMSMNSVLKDPVYKPITLQWLSSVILVGEVQCTLCEHLWRKPIELAQDAPGAFFYVLPEMAEEGQVLVSPICQRCVEKHDSSEEIAAKCCGELNELFGGDLEPAPPSTETEH